MFSSVLGTAHLGHSIAASEGSANQGWERKQRFSHPLAQAALSHGMAVNLLKILERRLLQSQKVVHVL